MIEPYMDQLILAAKKAGIELAVAAGAAGIAPSSVSRWRAGTSPTGPRLDVARRILKAIDFLSPAKNSSYTLFVADLVRRRMVQGLSQAVINERIGVATGLVSKWECGDRRPGKFLLVCWAQALGVEIPQAVLEALEVSKREDDPRRASVRQPARGRPVSGTEAA